MIKDMLGNKQKVYLDAMGIDVWVRRDQSEQTLMDASVPRVSTLPAAEPVAERSAPLDKSVPDDISSMDWAALEAKVAACQLCELHQTRTQTVFGVGNRNASLLIVGEAPGADEDRQGEPFVGQAGQLLNAMLQAIQLARSDVYIANILKCHPPQNRDPAPEEAALCSPYLQRQIELMQPTLILALGRIAAQRLLQSDTSLAKLRGQTHRFAPTNTPLVVTYHPAYLLRAPTEKAKAWQDLLYVKRLLEA